MFKKRKRYAVGTLFALSCLVACSSEDETQVIIQSNADEEAIIAMQTALDVAGYDGQYRIQALGTSELGGRMIAEGQNIDADIVTMSSYFIETAQQEHDMFTDLTFTAPALAQYPTYYTPLLANTGSIFVNTALLEEKGLDVPTSLKDLTDAKYKDLISLPNILDSSTGWLFVQAVIDAYGETEGQTVLSALIQNAGPHLESSGSGPIKKVKSGEVVAGFGLRHQAVLAQEEGAPITFVDPTEGNFSLTESVAVVEKDDDKTALAMEMAEVLVTEAREDLLAYYPVALYEGERIESIFEPAHMATFKQPLTVALLEKHQQFFTDAK